MSGAARDATPRFVPFGDGALRATLARALRSDAVGGDALGGDAVRAIADALRGCDGVVDVVVSDRHVAVYLAAGVTLDAAGAHAFDAALARAEARTGEGTQAATAHHRLRVRYDGADLDAVASFAGVTRDDVVRLHSARVYVVERIGFLPGFAYLGEVDPRIAAPRRSTPRPRIEPLSVGIAGARTGIYPFASPGGWNLVGTAIDFAPFDATRGATFAVGDRVVFEPA